eukprot:CAMPEP_0170473410 /NCGR_PEP_ID=MMETSP0123-20130129/15314_1 /TAXON_ID=182087 /ORGANISM="Favella ehrenbergii, Strain Fehren 1" /LENGTH=54 /DNA_ID=CAMNT_0010742399 /DNA_START=232 /DNA_END=396 /DNA_ORIENTATION=-
MHHGQQQKVPLKRFVLSPLLLIVVQLVGELGGDRVRREGFRRGAIHRPGVLVEE